MSPRMKFTLAFFTALWLWAFFGGHFLHDKPNANDIALDTEVKIFRNFRMHIDRKEKKADGSYHLVVRCDYQGQPAGLNLFIKTQKSPQGPGGKGDDSNPRGQVVFESLGPESNHFLRMMEDYYVTRLSPKPMVGQLNCAFQTVEGNPRDLDQAPVQLELYCPEKNKISPGAFELSVDWNHDLFYLMEKSTDYRKPILLAFRGD
jgi:hypothetical protein